MHKIAISDYALQYTTINNANLLLELYNVPRPSVINFKMLPLKPTFDNRLYLSYDFIINTNAIESGTQTKWYRRRTGINTILVNDAAISPLPASAITVDLISNSIVGIGSTNSKGYTIRATFGTDGKITNTSIKSRGYNLTTDNIPALPDTFTYNSTVYSNVLSILPLSNIYLFDSTGVSTDYKITLNEKVYVQITPDNVIGSATTSGIGTTVFPEYNNRFTERSVDVANRSTFDAYDEIVASIVPYTSFSNGKRLYSNIVTIRPSYKPSVGIGSTGYANITATFISTSPPIISAFQNIIANYTFVSNVPGDTPENRSGITTTGRDLITWYCYENSSDGTKVGTDFVTTGIGSGGVLSSDEVLVGRYIFYKLIPVNGPDEFDEFTYGDNYYSDIYEVN